MATPHPKMVEVPIAVIAMKPGIEASTDDIITFLEERLAKFKVTLTIGFFYELPKSGTGALKISILMMTFLAGCSKKREASIIQIMQLGI